ncbi:hypothetical protein [Caballeronia sp. NCTM1]|uniref:hypothetical protein n=1 Tax=Caballeronia sp. NCTM1 TaxID=2921753 RepID=UPI002027B5E0|nr:hypothetical protein [Caballeronia sp. NCTM1]
MSVVSLIVIALVTTLFVLCVLAVVMVGAEFERESDNEMGVLLDSVGNEKHRLIVGAMKADREAAIKRMGGGA